MKHWKRALPALIVLLLALFGFLELQYAQNRQWERLEQIQEQLRALQEQVDSIDREDSKALQKQIDELQAQLDSMESGSAPTVSSTQIVCITPSGGSYHKKDCSSLANSETVWERTEAEAAAQGYSPCSRCQP